jgi:putative CocE/NonD family hydrolase
MKHPIVIAACLLLFPLSIFAQSAQDDSAFVVQNFNKIERMVTMRDGIRLFTSIYIPKDQGEKYPILMERTPYSCAPYGENKFPTRRIGPNPSLMREKYIFVYQDVRGRFKSEGQFDEMTPAKDQKRSPSQTDESSDTYDSIDWLLKNIPGNNGKVGIYGISYPGFYASAALADAHPALKAVSPQAPVTDEFIGDDAYHNGAFFLIDNFDFTNYFQGTRVDSGSNYTSAFKVSHNDAYQFFLNLGPLKNTNGPRFFNNKAKIWNEYLEHQSYDAYWQARNIRPHLKNIKPAVLVVGGWFDAEDLFGTLRTYEAIEKQNPQNNNKIVMGPWTHGAWSRPEWTHFGTDLFGENINKFYQDEIETKFFNFYLKDKGQDNLSEATVYETGTNKWKSYSQWPPANAAMTKYYLRENALLTTEPGALPNSFDEYLSDPSRPVPYIDGISEGRRNEYMIEDQRFAAERPDVLVYQSGTLEEDLTITGRLRADIFMSSTGTDADLVVKLIDVFPETEIEPGHSRQGDAISGLERMVRAEVFRCKFRNDYDKPRPLKPGEPTEVAFSLNEIAHTFKKGHRLMVQIQSSWFPLVDRNPQQFVNISECKESDFRKADIRIYHDKEHLSSILLPVLH